MGFRYRRGPEQLCPVSFPGPPGSRFSCGVAVALLPVFAVVGFFPCWRKTIVLFSSPLRFFGKIKLFMFWKYGDGSYLCIPANGLPWGCSLSSGFLIGVSACSGGVFPGFCFAGAAKGVVLAGSGPAGKNKNFLFCGIKKTFYLCSPETNGALRRDALGD